ncbi:MAG: hypothetical protein COA77_04240 [Thaumarchaeota archaeon]|nr:MAG: hypothetical protein COA77_04240 [Nitrososphaerota archaeon]
MKDGQLRILVLTKLYELNRNHASVHELEKNMLFQGIEPNQLNFCFQYLGTLNLIQNASTNHVGIYNFSPQFITGKGIDIVESLMLDIKTKIKNNLFEKAHSVIEKIPIFLAEASVNQDLWDMLIVIFDKLIKAIMVIF